MDVRGLVWVGTRTKAFRETVRFFHETLELPVGHERPGFARLDLPDASCVEVFDAAREEYPHFSTGPVPGFEVADFDRARAELARVGYELLLPPGGEPGGYRWQHFRGPDGSVYELVDFPNRPAPGPALGALGVTKLAWVGISTSAFDVASRFLRETMRLAVAESTEELILCSLPDGSSVEILRRDGAEDYPHFRTGPVVGFGVTDIERAVGLFEKRGVPFLHKRRTREGGWAHFRAPDGCVYELKGVSRGPTG